MLNNIKKAKALAVFFFAILLVLGIKIQPVKAADDIIATPVVGDLDGDGQVTSSDYALMQQYLLGKIDSFPIESKVIKSIDNIKVTINQNDSYKLPQTVKAYMQNNSNRELPVTWSEHSIDTSICKTYRLIGSVNGYSPNVILDITVRSYIKNVENKDVRVEQYSNYKLPTKVEVILSDNTKEERNIIWDKKLDTSIEGVFTFDGTVENYLKKVKYTINIETKRNGNLFNGGYFTEAKGEVFYANPKDYGRLYKMGLNGISERIGDDNNIKYINIVDNWIYYSCYNDMYRIRKNGTDRENVTGNDSNSKGKLHYITSYNDEVYYSISDGFKDSIHKINKNGVDEVIFGQRGYSIYEFIVNNEWIYFSNGSDSGRLYKVKFDGTVINKVADDTMIYNFEVVNGNLIYAAGKYLKQIDLNSGIISNLSYDPSLMMKEMIVYKGKIYFRDPNSNYIDIYRSDLNGENKELVVHTSYVSGGSKLVVANDKLYILSYTYTSYKSDLDGKNLVEFGKDKFINKIEDLNFNVVRGEKFLPQDKVYAKYNDGSGILMNVVWNTQDFDTSSIGVKKYVGKVEGYEGNVNLTLNVTGNDALGNKNRKKFYEYDGDIYYIEDSQYESINVIGKDGNNRLNINKSHTNFFNIIDDWIYYSDSAESPITKMKIDGTGKKSIYLGNAKEIVMYDNWIYFISGGSVCRIDREGKDFKKIIDGSKNPIKMLKIYGDYIYTLEEKEYMSNVNTYGKRAVMYEFTKSDLNGNKINSFKIDSRENDSFIEIQDIFISGGYIYCYAPNYLINLIIDPNGNIIEQGTGKYVDISTDYKLYIKYNLYLTNLDGSDGRPLLKENCDIDDAAIIGDWIYYTKKGSYYFQLYRVKLDGSNNELVFS